MKGINDGIHVDQIGYGIKDKKQVIVNFAADTFHVVEETGGQIVFTGGFYEGVFDRASGDMVYCGDFSAVQAPGRYYVSIPGRGDSYSFAIADRVYRDIKNAVLKAFYYQRCGMKLEAGFAGKWGHKACHLGKGIVYGREDYVLDGNGGWHDAGDYGKYTVAAATALSGLMLAYELFPDRFDDRLDIPESGSGMPDILNECRYELDWLLKMQDKASGGVFHKLTTKKFPGLPVMPEEDTAQLFFSPVSGAATGSFAAVTAMASRLYRSVDPVFADICLKASRKAWRWLEENSEAVSFRNPADILTGEYGDGNDTDERYWAAAELYRATQEQGFHDYIKAVYTSEKAGDCCFGWQDTGGFAKTAYLFLPEPEKDPEIYGYIKAEMLKAAASKLETKKADGYRITLKPDKYCWGSNMSVMNDAMLLIIMNKLMPDEEYLQAALDNLHYLLGRNSLNQCFLTGFGSKPVLRPHHRPSCGDGIEEPVPGLVSGGPDSGLHDAFAAGLLQGMPPARCFIDHEESYSTNEVAIYWNSPAVFVAGYFDR